MIEQNQYLIDVVASHIQSAHQLLHVLRERGELGNAMREAHTAVEEAEYSVGILKERIDGRQST